MDQGPARSGPSHGHAQPPRDRRRRPRYHRVLVDPEVTPMTFPLTRPASMAALLLLVLGAIGAGEEGEGRPRGSGVWPKSRAFLNLPSEGAGEMPALLSRTGAFRDVGALSPDPGLIPYDLNTPFWSDGAAKRRWISVPHGQQAGGGTIGFSAVGEWKFPPGTVFIKHFELAI